MKERQREERRKVRAAFWRLDTTMSKKESQAPIYTEQELSWSRAEEDAEENPEEDDGLEGMAAPKHCLRNFERTKVLS